MVLDAGMLDALSGRYFHAAIDGCCLLVACADEAIDLDRHALRLRPLRWERRQVDRRVNPVPIPRQRDCFGIPCAAIRS
jgi:hypothetical protein